MKVTWLNWLKIKQTKRLHVSYQFQASFKILKMFHSAQKSVEAGINLKKLTDCFEQLLKLM